MSISESIHASTSTDTAKTISKIEIERSYEISGSNIANVEKWRG